MKKNAESTNRAVIALQTHVFQNFTSKSNKLMVMQCLSTVAIRSNPKTWPKTIFIFQGDVLENWKLFFKSRFWCVYIFVSQDGSIENSANTIDYPLKIIWCNSSWLTMSVLPRISSKHRQFRANRRFQMAAHKQTLARLIWRLDILIEGRYQVVSQE